jgi:hypothetical protein
MLLIESATDRLCALCAGACPNIVARPAKPTTLGSLIEAIVAPHEDRGEGNVRRFSVTGCDMEISDSVISRLALILHEFATNSTKYGALSATAGEIQIHCADQVGNVAITWSEREGLRSLPLLAMRDLAIFSFATRGHASLEEKFPGTGDARVWSSAYPCRATA